MQKLKKKWGESGQLCQGNETKYILNNYYTILHRAGYCYCYMLIKVLNKSQLCTWYLNGGTFTLILHLSLSRNPKLVVLLPMCFGNSFYCQTLDIITITASTLGSL